MATDANCLFCQIVAGKAPSDVVRRTGRWVAFRDINPQAPTHLLVVPTEHIPTLNDLRDEHAVLIGELVLAAKELAEAEGVAESGYRVVFNCNAGAGQSVFHIHLHLLGGRRFRWPPG